MDVWRVSLDNLSQNTVVWLVKHGAVTLLSDELVLEYVGHHGFTIGQTYLAGCLKSVGLRIQMRRIRECLARVDPANTALRWAIVVSCRQY